jgi:elongation factor 1 alpha-like protein
VFNVLTGLPVPAYPLPPVASSPSSHFSAKDFFRDSPWLNVPAHRKGEILIEPLYPRLGLLGGAPESGGKVSKLAALAAARKKKETDKAASGAPTTPGEPGTPDRTPTVESKLASLSLRERLAGNGKAQKPSESGQLPRTLRRGTPSESPLAQKKLSPEPSKAKSPEMIPGEPTTRKPCAGEEETERPKASIRAPPSTFASTIVGANTRPQITEPSHLYSSTVDLMQIYGQDLTEPFDFAGPSPDDVVLNAQSSAKGLAIRRKI